MDSLHDFMHLRKGREGGYINTRFKGILLIAILILSLTASFGLGRLSALNSRDTGISVGEIELNTMSASAYEAKQSTQNLSNQTGDGVVVASKNSDKYHYPWCSGAKRIKEENKIYFDSIADARNAGYVPAGNCEGLE